MHLDPIILGDEEHANLIAIQPAAQETLLRGGGSKWSFPLRTVEELIAYVRSADGPTHLVLFEYTGAVLLPLLGKGTKVMSVDKRAPLHNGPSYQGDAKDVVHLKTWVVVYCVGPNCFQHLVYDSLLHLKIDDGRAFWAGARVVWCVWGIPCVFSQKF